MDNRIGFLRWCLGDEPGYIAIGVKVAEEGDWIEQLFEYPSDLEGVSNHILKYSGIGDMYFCPTVLSGPKRIKKNVHHSYVIYADMDECPPELFKVEPTVVTETSPGRYQGFWKLEGPTHALDVEKVNKRIAYAHADQGCDRSGWDLTQYLRIPQTNNFKRAPDVTVVKMFQANTDLKYTLDDFDVYPVVSETEIHEVPFPTSFPDMTGEEIIECIKTQVHPNVWKLFKQVPEKDWSANIWSLELLLFAAGCTMEEVFLVIRDAACNKYARDQSSNLLLWKEVVRAHAHSNNQTLLLGPDEETEVDWHLPDVDLLTIEERDQAEATHTILDDYMEWAKLVGDAAPQYHTAGAFIILSCLLSGSVKLPTSFGIVLPNMWFMILADTTLTRKTTAMDMAMDLVSEIDSDAMMATDGSIEGLMGSIATRPNRASVFLRDEFSGLLEAMVKKDYYAGMLEAFTKLYDGKFQKRVLRKETIEIRDPCLILFTGGIKERIFQLLTYDHINSGFIPRFCFITAESDIERIRPLGPPTAKTLDSRAALLEKLHDIYNHYQGFDQDPDDEVLIDATWNATLTDEAWVRYNKFEAEMLTIGLDSSMPDLMTPMMARLCTSGLKAAVLISASRRLVDRVEVTLDDLIKAFYYVEGWKSHAINVVANAGKTATEKQLERIYAAIQDKPGIKRGVIMQQFRLTARDGNAIFDTLEQRGLIRSDKNKGKAYFPTNTTKVNKKK